MRQASSTSSCFQSWQHGNRRCFHFSATEFSVISNAELVFREITSSNTCGFLTILMFVATQIQFCHADGITHDARHDKQEHTHASCCGIAALTAAVILRKSAGVSGTSNSGRGLSGSETSVCLHQMRFNFYVSLLPVRYVPVFSEEQKKYKLRRCPLMHPVKCIIIQAEVKILT